MTLTAAPDVADRADGVLRGKKVIVF